MLIHAAAGGVGLLAVQMAKLLGAKVIGTVSTPEKAALVKNLGADLVINYQAENIEEAVQSFTKGEGVDVVYDSIGQSTFNHSLACLKNRGLIVSFGQASGVVPPIDLNETLSRRQQQHGSLYITRPTLKHYIPNAHALQIKAAELFNNISSGQIKLHINAVYPLKEATTAHQMLQSRQTIGKILLKT
jgi:NADPH2:quinone reductase